MSESQGRSRRSLPGCDEVSKEVACLTRLTVYVIWMMRTSLNCKQAGRQTRSRLPLRTDNDRSEDDDDDVECTNSHSCFDPSLLQLTLYRSRASTTRWYHMG